MMEKSRFRRGFTLIELLVVMSVIGILVTISSFGLQGARESARDSRRKSDLETLRSAMELYRSDCGFYPPSVSFGGQLVGSGNPSCNGNVYLEDVPEDPRNDRSYSYSRGPGNFEYSLCAAMEVTEPEDTSGCAGCGGEACTFKVTEP